MGLNFLSFSLCWRLSFPFWFPGILQSIMTRLFFLYSISRTSAFSALASFVRIEPTIMLRALNSADRQNKLGSRMRVRQAISQQWFKRKTIDKNVPGFSHASIPTKGSMRIKFSPGPTQVFVHVHTWSVVPQCTVFCLSCVSTFRQTKAPKLRPPSDPLIPSVPYALEAWAAPLDFHALRIKSMILSTFFPCLTCAKIVGPPSL